MATRCRPSIIPTAAVAASFWCKSNFDTPHSTKTDTNYNRWTLNCAVSCLPKNAAPHNLLSRNPVGLNCCGEDAFIIAENDFQIVLAVADGVGSWRSKGVDPSAFSRGLMKQLERIVIGEREIDSEKGYVDSSTNQPSGPTASMILLKSSFWRLIRGYFKGMSKPFGSSTVCIVSLDKSNGKLDTCNLGDSGFVIIRGNRIVARSMAQQHRFNAPFQLMLTPDGDVNDCSHMSASHTFSLQSDDLVIVASDGLWDNLFENDILSIVMNEKPIKPTEIATRLVGQARKFAEREDYDSPFSVESRRHGKNHQGGKLDDITVIVGVVQSK